MFGENFKIDNSENLNNLIKIIKKRKIDVVCFDSFARMHSGKDENNSTQISKIFSCFRRICRNGASVVILHHNRKSNDESGQWQTMRGSSDIQASVDCHISIKKKGDILKIIQHKLRQGEELPPFSVKKIVKKNKYLKLKFIGKDKIIDTDLEIEKEIITMLKKKKMSQEKIVKELSNKIGRNKVLIKLNELEISNKIKCKKSAHGKKVYLPV
jgi:RecA-family ATPase